MIRSRSSKKLESFSDIFPEDVNDSEWLSTRPRTRSRHPKRYLKLALVVILVFVLSVPALRKPIARHTAALILHPGKNVPILKNKPPLVDRKILDKLQSLDESEDELEDSESSNVRQWPPKVTRIPEPQPPQHPLELSQLDFEKQFCPSTSINPTTSSCQFLLPLWISEQESKARIHLLQLLHLARSLNRTLVLPNTGKSRLATCLKWDFDVYYDKEHLLDQAVDVVSIDRFKVWTNTRSDAPAGQLVSLNWTAAPVQLEQPHSVRKELDVYIHKDLADPFSKRAYCLTSKLHRLHIIDTYYPLSVVFTTHAQESLEDGSLAQALIEELTDEDTLLNVHRNASAALGYDNEDAYYYDEDTIAELLEHTSNEMDAPHPSIPPPDVLIVNWDLRLPLFPSTALPTLNYSPRLQALTTRLTNPISPYLAVHWRMESVPPEVLPSCAETLVSTLHDILSENKSNADIKHIWLASDIGSGGSGTFKTLTEDHIQAHQILKDAFNSDSGGGPLSRFKLTGLKEELERMVRLGEEMDDLIGDGGAHGRREEVLLDSGVLGILDKLVAMRAAIFVSGGNGCGRIRYVLTADRRVVFGLTFWIGKLFYEADS
jgi:hypothetical protein